MQGSVQGLEIDVSTSGSVYDTFQCSSDSYHSSRCSEGVLDTLGEPSIFWTFSNRRNAPVLAARDGYIIFDLGSLRGILQPDRVPSAERATTQHG